MMRNLEGPNRSLQAELVLQERMNEIKHLNHQNRRLNEECRLSQINAMKLIQKFERKARESRTEREREMFYLTTHSTHFRERDVAFAHGAMGHRIDPSWGGPIELFTVIWCQNGRPEKV